MPKILKHTHKLRKHKYPTGHTVFFCTLDCNFKIDSALALGKKVICNICDEEFVMNEYALKLHKPHCENCGRVKVKDSEGNTRYVKKMSSKVLTEIATNTTTELRNRLDSVAAVSSDEDI